VIRVCLVLGLLLAVAACAPAGSQNSRDGDFIRNLPEEVVAISASYQNLQAVRLLPEDGCYWYQHVGPVETTLLPLRTVEGRPICTRVASEETETE